MLSEREKCIHSRNVIADVNVIVRRCEIVVTILVTETCRDKILRLGNIVDNFGHRGQPCGQAATLRCSHLST